MLARTMDHTCAFCSVILAAPAPGATLVCQNNALPADDAAIRERMAKALGSPLPKGGRLVVPRTGVAVIHSGAIASTLYDAPGRGGFPRWKEALDAGWDLLRSAVLGLDVKVNEAALQELFRQ